MMELQQEVESPQFHAPAASNPNYPWQDEAARFAGTQQPESFVTDPVFQPQTYRPTHLPVYNVPLYGFEDLPFSAS
jgi:hypothetical protein